MKRPIEQNIDLSDLYQFIEHLDIGCCLGVKPFKSLASKQILVCQSTRKTCDLTISRRQVENVRFRDGADEGTFKIRILILCALYFVQTIVYTNSSRICYCVLLRVNQQD